MRNKKVNIVEVDEVKKTKRPSQKASASAKKLPEVSEYPYSYDIRDYIVVMEDVIDSKLCDRILKEYKNCSAWKPSSVGTGVVNPNVRNVDSIGISIPEVIAMNEKVRRDIDNELFNALSVVIKKYNEKFEHSVIEKDSGYDLLRYNTGQFYLQHCDSFATNPRTVSCSISLNDNYEGGEFAFFNKNVIKKVPKGGVILFPSSFHYPHEILPVTKGTRYSIITWFL